LGGSKSQIFGARRQDLFGDAGHTINRSSRVISRGSYFDNHMKREQTVLKSLIVMVAMMLTTTAFAQEDSWCRENSQRLKDLRPALERAMARVELVPPDEADYIQKEEGEATQQGIQQAFQQGVSIDSISSNRLNALRKRRFYPAAKFHDYAGSVMNNFKAAEHATSAKDVAKHLIDALSGMSNVETSMKAFIEIDAEREQPTLSRKDNWDIENSAHLVRLFTTRLLQCIVKGL
jgi:hypothetical protein